MQICAGIAVEHFVPLPHRQIRDRASNASHSDHAESLSVQSSTSEKLVMQLLDEVLREDWTTDLEFDRRSRPRDHRKRRGPLFKQKHAARSLLDATQRITLQDFRRRTRDAVSTVIEHEDAAYVALTQCVGSDLPESFHVTLKVRAKLARLGQRAVDNSDAHVAQHSNYGRTI